MEASYAYVLRPKAADTRKRIRSSTMIDHGGLLDWASLLPELLQAIADSVLLTSTGGIGSYMDMRAVCSCWRSSIAKPSPLVAVTDLRFRPRRWVMMDLKSKNHEHGDAENRLFIHVLSGRFRSLRLPALRDHILVGASDGLLVLQDKEPPHLVCVLNPLTGDILHFAAALHEHQDSRSVVYTGVRVGPHSTMVLCRRRGIKVECADPTNDFFAAKDIGACLTSMVTFQGNVYYADTNGRVFKIVGPAMEFHHELVTLISPDLDVCLKGENGARSELVESNGELLLVRLKNISLKVFKVDVEHRLLKEVKSLGGRRALFLGHERCLSVDADKLPSVDCDCIYMYHSPKTSEQIGWTMCVYNLRDGRMEIISSEPMLHIQGHLYRPLSLVQVLLSYCINLTQF